MQKPLDLALARAVSEVLKEQLAALKQETKESIEQTHETLRWSVKGLDQRIDGISVINGKDGEKGLDGKDGEPGKDGRDGVDGKDGAPGLDGKDGRDGIDGKDGQDGIHGKDGSPGVDGKDGRDGIDGIHGKDGRDGIDGKDGTSVDPEEVRKQVTAEVIRVTSEQLGDIRSEAHEILEAAVKALPLPEPGKDGLNGQDGKDGRDGVDGKSVALSDIEDMLDNKFANWALDWERRAMDMTQRVIDRMPTPAPGKDGRDGVDGVNGKDGKDGFGFDDLSVECDVEAQTLVFKFARGEEAKEFAFEVPWPVDKGVFKRGIQYKRGACVSFGGSVFIAQRDTDAAPETPDCGWRLAIKRGRDGKDGKDGDRGIEGKEGPRGRDLTQIDYQSGRKF